MVTIIRSKTNSPKMHKSKYTLLYYITISMVLTLTACQSRTVHSQYKHVPTTGWEKNDALSFSVSPLKTAGTYQEEIGVRINHTYPFMGLTLIIDQAIIPSYETISDTLECSLIDDDGNSKGPGIGHYQFDFPLTTLELQEGDSLHISIRHDMKREILPGIADIGITLKK